MKEPRLVAVDEDGTFLRDHHTYDRARFERIFCRMQELGSHFVVATGNQCYQVMDLFPAHVADMAIVSANGAHVMDAGEVVYHAEASSEAVDLMIRACHDHPRIPFSMLGVNGAYVERGLSQEFFDDMATYCYRQSWVDDYSQVDDKIFMFSSVVAEAEVADAIELFRSILDGRMDVVGSGEGYFDVVCPGVSKATGLRCLMDRWGVDAADCVAFGDSDNDLAMLSLVGTSYAMQNAPAHVRQAADHVAPPCTEDGVLQVLEELFGL